MSRDLQRRLAKVEAEHRRQGDPNRRIQRMTDAELTAAVRACTAKLAADVGPDWRSWLAENDPASSAVFEQLERDGLDL